MKKKNELSEARKREKLSRLLRGTETLASDFEEFADETSSESLSEMFAEYADDEAIHASWLKEQIERLNEID